MSEQREDERGVVWAVLIGVVLLAIGLAVGMGLYRTGKNAGQATATASSAATATPMRDFFFFCLNAIPPCNKHMRY